MENYNNIPGSPGPTDSGMAREQLSVPSILLIVTGVLGELNGLWGLVKGAVARGQDVFAPFRTDPNMQQFLPLMERMMSLGWVINVMVLALSAVTIVGALKMKNLQGYGLAMAASIIAMVPCFGPCCCIGLPVGIWSLILLNKPEIKSAFRD